MRTCSNFLDKFTNWALSVVQIYERVRLRQVLRVQLGPVIDYFMDEKIVNLFFISQTAINNIFRKHDGIKVINFANIQLLSHHHGKLGYVQNRFRGVVVITSALHAEGREFEPRRNLFAFSRTVFFSIWISCRRPSSVFGQTKIERVAIG